MVRGRAAVVSAFGDLFDAPRIPGLFTSQLIITEDEEQTLIRCIDECELTPFEFQGWTGKRLTISFGTKYDFARNEIMAAPPMPDWLENVRARAAHAAKLQPADLTQALLIRYDPGAGIGWHKDRPVYEHVVGISLGAHATMRFRQRRAGGFARVNVELLPRAMYHLSGEVRYEWEHSIAPMDKPRWSITFRSLSAAGDRLARRQVAGAKS